MRTRGDDILSSVSSGGSQRIESGAWAGWRESASTQTASCHPLPALHWVKAYEQHMFLQLVGRLVTFRGERAVPKNTRSALQTQLSVSLISLSDVLRLSRSKGLWVATQEPGSSCSSMCDARALELLEWKCKVEESQELEQCLSPCHHRTQLDLSPRGLRSRRIELTQRGQIMNDSTETGQTFHAAAGLLQAITASIQVP